MGRGHHPETFLPKALCCQSAPLLLKVGSGNEQAAMWWVVAPRIILSSGTGGTLYFPFPISHFPFPISHFPFPIPHFPFPISHSPFPIPNSPFPWPELLFNKMHFKCFLKSSFCALYALFSSPGSFICALLTAFLDARHSLKCSLNCFLRCSLKFHLMIFF